MIPIYEAIDFKGAISENVGHTKPWVVLANTNEGLKPFIVKLYSNSQVDHFHCVSKEIFCNLLAHEFDLSVPSFALIDIPEMLSCKAPPEAQLQFDKADHRYKFATIYLDNVKSALPTLPKSIFQNRVPLDTLYAFDNLIRNCDRGRPKTNLLIGKKFAYLIDHELALCENDITNIDLNTIQFEDKYTKNHLFYHFLKKTRGEARRNLFNDFSFYIENLSLNKFSQYFEQLKVLGFIDYSQTFCNWINHVKENKRTFVNYLKGSVQ